MARATDSGKSRKNSRHQDPGAERIDPGEQENELDEFQEGEEIERRRRREYREKKEEQEGKKAGPM